MFFLFQPDCGSIITSKDPPFSRLEHHKIHEYARVACGKGVRPANPNANQDHMKRRRGRPPKYPKNEIPIVPKVREKAFLLLGQF